MSAKNKTVHFKNCLGVFQGGGCKAIAFVGAYEEAFNRGVYFSEVAGTSAGSIFAALIAAGATPKKLKEIIELTNFEKFNSKKDKSLSKFGSNLGLMRHGSFGLPKAIFTFLTYLGLYSSSGIEVWLNGVLKDLLGIKNRNVQFGDLKLPLHVVATDLSQQKQKVWNSLNTPEDDVAFAVRSSCSIPFYFQPVDMRYVDGGLVSNLPSFSLAANEPNFEKVLCFTLNEQPSEITDIKGYIESLVGAVIDGAIHIQGLLQENLYYIKIGDLPITTTAFEKLDNKTLNLTIDKGKEAAKKFFFEETHNVSKNQNNKPHLSLDLLYNSVVTSRPENCSEIAACLRNTRLVYQLFPSIIDWVKKCKNVTFITLDIDDLQLKKEDYLHEEYRRLLLKNLGVNLIFRKEISFDGILFKGVDDQNNKSVIFYNDDELIENVGYGKIYQGRHDHFVHKSFWEILKIGPIKPIVTKNRIVPMTSPAIIKLIKNVSQYNNDDVSVKFKTVPIDKIRSLTKYVKSYKYNQIPKIFKLLKHAEIDLFDAAAVRLHNKVKVMITPPVFEKHGDNYILIEGNSRVNYCYRDLGMTEIKAIVIENVDTPLPSSDLFEISEMIITTKNIIGKTRYPNFIYENFRKIEETVREPKHLIEVLK